ncbi:MAG: hypothetical protein EVG15_07485 [Candidatus Acididesulfobacter diazotrophicus]|uniref:Uncharacterized protein n=1 Tax=Candidatus Acididesulfobacter diazotrophicus TaxID=2597226 RepID=A0A519BLL9_9DELT|nr:MAG: hypothetical protein EVG15_07485 [Candidatus Acididesulfobacter diazotrophicus]
MNKKYRVFLFSPLAAIAIFYLIGAADISYIFNVPMIMTPIQVGMPMQMWQATGKPIKKMEKTGSPFFSKANPEHSNKLNLQSYITCVECQNLPTAYRPVLFYYGSFIKTILFAGKIYSKHFSSDIPHPPQNHLI